jgi:TonB family protein
MGSLLFLSACTVNQGTESQNNQRQESTQSKNINGTGYLDLIGDKDAVLNYWIVDKAVNAEYPLDAQKYKVSGCIEFSFVINSDGMVDDLIIVKSFPETMFDKQAIEAINKWIWLPTETNINKQTVATTIQFDFITKKSVNMNDAEKACRI